MRTKIMIYGLLAVIVAGGIGYFMWADRLPPRTPIKVARAVSDLPLPSSARVIEFHDQWMDPTGDGESFVVLALSAAQIQRIAEEAALRGYGPIDEAGLSAQVSSAVIAGSQGFARSSGTHLTGSSVVVDTINNRVIVHSFSS